MATTFRQALLDALQRTGVPLTKVAADAGVSYEQLKKVKQREGASTNVDDAKAVANYFGFTLDEFLGDGTAEDRAEIARLYSQLSPRERAILRAAQAAGLAPGQDEP